MGALRKIRAGLYRGSAVGSAFQVEYVEEQYGIGWARGWVVYLDGPADPNAWQGAAARWNEDPYPTRAEAVDAVMDWLIGRVA